MVAAADRPAAMVPKAFHAQCSWEAGSIAQQPVDAAGIAEAVRLAGIEAAAAGHSWLGSVALVHNVPCWAVAQRCHTPVEQTRSTPPLQSSPRRSPHPTRPPAGC